MTSSKKIAVFPGSFDPITLGHLDILKDSSKIFDKVIIAIAMNPNKKYLLSVEERKNLIKNVVINIPNVEVDNFDGLTVNYAREKSAQYIIRGLRSNLDFEYEKELAQINKQLAPEISTLFFMTNPDHNFISSSAVREILSHSGDISLFIPKSVKDYLITKF